MKRRVFLTTLLLVIVCAAMLVLAGRDRTRANEAYEKWEYLTVAAPSGKSRKPHSDARDSCWNSSSTSWAIKVGSLWP